MRATPTISVMGYQPRCRVTDEDRMFVSKPLLP